MVELRGEPDLTKKPIRGHADQELGVEDLEGYPSAGRVRGEKDPGVAAPADLPLDILPPEERLAHQRHCIASNDRHLDWGLFNGCARVETAQAAASPLASAPLCVARVEARLKLMDNLPLP